MHSAWRKRPNAAAWKKKLAVKLKSTPGCAPNRKPGCAQKSRPNCAPKPLNAGARKKKHVGRLRKKPVVGLKKKQEFLRRKKRAAKPKLKRSVAPKQKLDARPKRPRACEPKRTRADTPKNKRTCERNRKRVSALKPRVVNELIWKRASVRRSKLRFEPKKTSNGEQMKRVVARNTKESSRKRRLKPQNPITPSRSSDLKLRTHPRTSATDRPRQ